MQQLIQQLHKEKFNNDSNSQDLARTLDYWIDSTFATEDRIFYELLQNADDAAVDEPLHFNVFLLKEYLVFNYNGKPFTAADLCSLCSVGDSAKTKQTNKIGYKGIGFKSVFKITDCAWVQSQESCFRFDKQYKNQHEQQYPWQIIPIWTDPAELPQEVLELEQQQGAITIVLKIKEEVGRKCLRRRLNAIYGKPQLILFLRAVTAINCYTLGKDNGPRLSLQILREDQAQQGIRQLSIIKGDSILPENYLAREFVLEIPQHIQQILQTYADNECPQKLKNATSIQLTLAAQLDEQGQIKEAKMSDLFCFLPTQIRKQLPFIVNGEFLTNPERTQLLYDNRWNDFLFEQIARCQCHWLEEIVQQAAFKYQMPKLIRLPYKNKNKQDKNFTLYRAFNLGLQNELAKVAFLPDYASDQLLLLGNSVIDQTQYSFQDDFDASDVKQAVKVKYKMDAPQVVDPKLEDLEKLIQLGAATFNVDLLRDMLNSSAWQAKLTPHLNRLVVEFLAETIMALSSKLEERQWNQALQDAHFLLCQKGSFRLPAELYFSLPAEIEDSCLLQLPLHLHFLHESINASLSKEARNWLNSIGVKRAEPLQIIRYSLLEKLFQEDKLQPKNVIAISRCIFQYRKLLESEDYQKLKESLLVLTQSGDLQKVWNTYLADVYQAEFPVETIATNTQFVSADYPENLENEEELLAWRRFFKKMQVQEKMALQEWDKGLNRQQLLSLNLPKIEDYLDFLARKFKTNQFELQHFSSLTLFENLSEQWTDFARYFWETLLTDLELWKKLKSSCDRFRIQLKGEKPQAALSYFEYMCRHTNCFPTTQGVCKPCSTIYSSQFEQLLSASQPCSFIDLSRMDEAFLGIRSELTIEELLDLLQDIAAQQLHSQNLQRLQEVYLLLGRPYHQLNTHEQTILENRREQIHLLASDLSFQPLNDLYYFNANKFTPPTSSPYFIYNFEPYPKLMAAIYELFQIPAVDEEEMELQCTVCKEDPLLKTQLLERITAIAFIAHKKYADSLAEKEAQLMKQLAALTTFTATDLTLDFNAGVYTTALDAWLDANELYYRGDWQSPEVLYAMAPLLCTYLDLGDLEREVQLVLTLPEAALKRWLSQEGAPQALTQQLAVTTSPAYSMAAEASPHYSQELSEAETSKIGRRGEAFLYEWLQEQYSDDNLYWENELEEKRLPYDFSLQKEAQTIFVEAKSTTATAPFTQPIRFSLQEWKFFLEHYPNYRFYRVYDLDAVQPQVLEVDLLKVVQLQVVDGGLLLFHS